MILGFSERGAIVSIIGISEQAICFPPEPQAARRRRTTRTSKARRRNSSRSKRSFSNWDRILQSGNLAQAQQDYTTLSQNISSVGADQQSQQQHPGRAGIHAAGQATCSRETCRPRSRTSPRRSRAPQQSAQQVHGHHGRHHHHAEGAQSASASSQQAAPSTRRSAHWRRLCSLEIFPERNRLSPR